MDITPTDRQVGTPLTPERAPCQKASPLIRFVQIFLLVLIVIGLGLLATTKFWVPKVVTAILGQSELPDSFTPINETNTPHAQQISTTTLPTSRTYERTSGNGIITITTVSPSEVFVQGSATWQGANEGQINDGVFEATSTLEDGKISISEVAASSASINSCVVSIEILKDGDLKVDDESCIWGLNVTFSGRYVLSTSTSAARSPKHGVT
jgi:hypothetical protein